jgi:hypothetical protein
MTTPSTPRPGFREFYSGTYLAEHRHPANIALHVLGTTASGLYLVAMLLSPLPWLALFYPVVHALPGLVGHRLFERNVAVGDVRVLRTDFPAAWFIAANHRLTFDVLRRARPLQRRGG